MMDIFDREPRPLSRASFSADGRYRYILSRRWGDLERTVTFILLNPSTADAEHDDPTMRRCIQFAKDWGFSALHVVNLFAWRATDPKWMRRAAVDPIGLNNDAWIREACAGSDMVVCAWGEHGTYLGRSHHVKKILVDGPAPHKIHALRFNRSGEPAHPLYMPKHTKPMPWTPLY